MNALVTVLGLVAVSAAILAVVADWEPSKRRDAGCLRLFLRCLRWGVATGGVTGAVVAAMVVLLSGLGNGTATSVLGAVPFAVFYGAIVGALVSVLPSVLGGLVVTGLIRWRHPQPSSGQAVHRDLIVVFRCVVAVLDAALLMALIAEGTGLASVASPVPFILAGNVCVVVMLCRARASIGRVWSEAAR